MNSFKLRTLKSSDMFLMLKILSKIGISDLKNKFTPEKLKEITSNKQDTTAVGFSVITEIAGVIIEHLPDCETEIYKFLSSISDISPEEIKALDMVTFTKMIVTVLKKEEFRDFIKVVSGLFKQDT